MGTTQSRADSKHHASSHPQKSQTNRKRFLATIPADAVSEMKAHLHVSPASVIDPRGDPYGGDDVMDTNQPPQSTTPNLQLPPRCTSPASLSSFSTNHQPVGDHQPVAVSSLSSDDEVESRGIHISTMETSSDSLSAASDILERMREMARRVQRTTPLTSPQDLPEESNPAVSQSFSPIMKNVGVECAEEYSTEEVVDDVMEEVDEREEDEDAGTTSQQEKQPPQIHGDCLSKLPCSSSSVTSSSTTLKQRRESFRLQVPIHPPMRVVGRADSDWVSPCPSPVMGVQTLEDGSSILTVFVRKFGEDQGLWRDWAKKIERTMRGLQRQYGCLIKVYDEPVEHRGSKVHKIRIRGASHKDVLRCKNAFPHYIKTMLITSHEHYDDIVYDVVNRRNV